MSDKDFAGHTPGPWTVRSDEFIVEAPDGLEVCRAPDECDNEGGTRFIYRQNYRANARLIAAAPQLLADRQELVEVLRESLALLEECAEELVPSALSPMSAAMTRARSLLSRIQSKESSNG